MAKHEKPRILILSDMWGKVRLDWLPAYTEFLKPYFKIDFKDSSELAEIDLPIFVEDALHYEYVRWGIDRAVNNLSKESMEYDALLGFSLGGVIGWKTMLQNGLAVTRFYGVSATRLRYEDRKPSCPIRLYFGGDDQNAPDVDWQSRFGPNITFYDGHTHEMYYEAEVAGQICQQIVEDFNH